MLQLQPQPILLLTSCLNASNCVANCAKIGLSEFFLITWCMKRIARSNSRLRDDCERICHAKVLHAIWRMSNFAPNF